MNRIVVLLLILLTLIFFLPFLSGEQVFGLRDHALYFYPLRQLMVEQVRAGHLPLWNPYLYGGMPLLASLQIGFFYPMTLIHYILPFNLAFNWFTILHYFLAGLFTYLLMRHYKASEEASLLSGIVFAFSGYLLSVSTMNTTLTSVVWLPLTILFWDRLLSGGGRDWLWLVLTMTLMFLGGEPTIFYSTILILIIYAFFMGKIGKLWYLLPVVLLTLGLLAAQIFPLLEFTLNSVRTWRTEFDFISHSSLPPRETLNFILPNLWGSFLNGTYSKAILGSDIQTWILSPYIGLLSLFMAGLGVIAGRSRRAYFFLTAGILFLFLSFGRYTPFYKLLFRGLPGLSFIRYPVKFMFFPTFAVAILSGFGLDRLSRILNQKVLLAVGSIMGVILALVLGSGIFKRSLHTLISARLGLTEDLKFTLAALLNANLTNWLIIFLLLLFALVLLTLYYRKQIKVGILTRGLVALVALDLLIFNFNLNPPVIKELQTFVPLNAEIMLKDRSLFRYYVDPRVYEKSGGFYRDQTEVLVGLKTKLMPNFMIPHHLSDLMGRESIEPLRQVRFYYEFRDKFLPDRLDLLSKANVKYILSYERLFDPQLKLLSDQQFYLYQNLLYYPRAYIRGGECRIIKYEPNRVEITANSKSGGPLVLADSFDPGWKATIDGRPVKIELEEPFFRRVLVPAGERRVVFRYSPDSLKWGALVSLISLLVIIVIGFWNLRLNASVPIGLGRNRDV
ncbi:YfhO family protein [Candidatus Saganbacteria bacterium]|nr:YfhO family protein [Candidatus Saganbacteria bacterium]